MIMVLPLDAPVTMNVLTTIFNLRSQKLHYLIQGLKIKYDLSDVVSQR